MARLEHDLWRKAKEADGWVYGEQRDENKRTHPDLVSWDDLPEEEREKNLAMVRQITGFACTNRIPNRSHGKPGK